MMIVQYLASGESVSTHARLDRQYVPIKKREFPEGSLQINTVVISPPAA